MRHFAALYTALDRSTATRDKVAALIDYLRTAPERDAAWAVWLLCGGKVSGAGRKIANTTELRGWIADASGTPAWLVDESYAHVGDLAETLALLLDDPAQTVDEVVRADAGGDAPKLTLDSRDIDTQVHANVDADAPTNSSVAGNAPGHGTAVTQPPSHDGDIGLADWIEHRLLPVANAEPEARREVVLQAWRSLPFDQRLVFNKLLTGALRVGVSQRLVQQALAEGWQLDIARVAQRMLGDWSPTPAFLASLRDAQDQPADRAQPYPFFLASPLEGEPAALGPLADWLLEWKWDGIRVQLIKRAGALALWSRGEERLDGRFPEIEAALAALPGAFVIDGELLAWRADEPQPLPFAALQTRIQRRKPGPKTLADTPARVLAYDLLELDGIDLRSEPLQARRTTLEALLSQAERARLAVSPRVDAVDWPAAAALRDEARARGVEGLMLKRAASRYQSGRRRGDWWKWKVDPLVIDAVLLYAQAGHGRRSTLYTDYTFGVWTTAQDGVDVLVPVAKAYSGLDDGEIAELDRWIRAHTIERFGPVRSVQPRWVFELGFEAVNRSARHKSGVAVRFPRILRWRRDKPANEADQLATLQALAR